MKLDLYTRAKISPVGKVNKQDLERWGVNMLKFLIPMSIIYTGSVIGIVQQDNHIFSLVDFIPTKFTQGAIALYFLNAIQDLARKFLDAHK